MRQLTFQFLNVIEIAFLQVMNLQFVLQLNAGTQVMTAVYEKSNLKGPLICPISLHKILPNSSVSRLEKGTEICLSQSGIIIAFHTP